MTADCIIAHIRSLGYVVKEFHVNGVVEFHAVPLKGDEPLQIARCNDGDDDEADYKAVCLLAEAIGIDLEG